MKIFLRSTPDFSETEYYTCQNALANWYCDQVEWSRPPRLRGAPVQLGRDQEQTVILVEALVERQWGGRLDVPRVADPEDQAAEVLLALHERAIVHLRVEVTHADD